MAYNQRGRGDPVHGRGGRGFDYGRGGRGFDLGRGWRGCDTGRGGRGFDSDSRGRGYDPDRGGRGFDRGRGWRGCDTGRGGRGFDSDSRGRGYDPGRGGRGCDPGRGGRGQWYRNTPSDGFNSELERPLRGNMAFQHNSHIHPATNPPQQMLLNIPPNLMSPPMSAMQNSDEIEITYKIRRNLDFQQAPQPLPHNQQQISDYLHPNVRLPPPNMSKTQSLMNIQFPGLDSSRCQITNENKSGRRNFQSPRNNNLSRSASLQTIDTGQANKGARPKEFKKMRGNQRNIHMQERRKSSQERGTDRTSNSFGTSEDLESANEKEYKAGSNEMIANKSSDRGRTRERGRGRGRGAHGCNIATDGRKADHVRGRGIRENQRETKAEASSGAVYENQDTADRNREKCELDTNITQVKKTVHLHGGIRGRRRNRPTRSRNYGPNSRLGNSSFSTLRERETDSESSDTSTVFSLLDDTESERDPPVTDNDVRAGTDGMETFSIQTLKNRIVRYKKKLNELKKKENSDQVEIKKLEATVSELDYAVQKRIKEENQAKCQTQANEMQDKLQSSMAGREIVNEIRMDDKSNDDASKKVQKILRSHKHKIIASLRKANVVFRPKSNRKAATAFEEQAASNQIESNPTENEETKIIDEVTADSEFSDIEDEKPSQKTISKRRRRGKRNKKTVVGHGSGMVTEDNNKEDWQNMLEDLCMPDTETISKGNKAASTPLQMHPDVRSKKNKEGEGKRKNNKTSTRVNSIEHINDNVDNKANNNRANRKRSGSSMSDNSVDGPDEVEVFKFLIKEMKGEGTPLAIKERSTLFSDCNNINSWFRRHRNKFTIFERDTEILKVSIFVKGADYCLDYLTPKKCTKSGCNRYHICKHLLSGNCTFGKGCKFSHDCLDRKNLPISTELGFNNAFDNEQILCILSLRFPHVCEAWNETGSCSDKSCSKLHLCQRQVFGNCFEGDGCPFEHSTSTVQNQMVTKAYRMTNWKPQLFNKIIFVSRTLRPVNRNDSESPILEIHDRQNSRKGVETGIIKKRVNRDDTKMLQSEVFVVDGAERETIDGNVNNASGSRKSASKPLHTRPSRRMGHDKEDEDLFLREDENNEPKYLCEKQLLGYCETEGCSKFHGNTYGLPYFWQIKLYGKWISLSEWQSVKIEEEFCGLAENSRLYSIISEDGLDTQFNITFYPEIKALISHLECERLPTEARRLSTPSYAYGEFEESSFKTQWRWWWVDDKRTLQLFDTDMLQYTLEKKYISGQKKYLYSRENYRFKYCLDFYDMTQANLDTGKSRKVFRRPTFVVKDNILQKRFLPSLQPPSAVTVPLPEGWMVWDLAHPFELVELESTQKPYAFAESRFYQTLDRNAQIIDRIYRVQNPILWSAFKNHKGNMIANAERAGRSPNVKERMLFHGTDSLDTVRGISVNNFDHRLSGKNATVYGEGAYFAKTAKYSHAYTTPKPDRFMFIARVMVGEYTKGDRSYKRPPSKPGATHELYDSCVDNMDNPSIYIVFDRNQYYPEFLIQYHTSASATVSHPVGQYGQLASSSPVSAPNVTSYRRRARSPPIHGGYRASSPPRYIGHASARSPSPPSVSPTSVNQAPLSYPSTSLQYPGSPQYRTSDTSQNQGRRAAGNQNQGSTGGDETKRKNKDETSCVIQ